MSVFVLLSHSPASVVQGPPTSTDSKFRPLVPCNSPYHKPFLLLVSEAPWSPSARETGRSVHRAFLPQLLMSGHLTLPPPSLTTPHVYIMNLGHLHPQHTLSFPFTPTEPLLFSNKCPPIPLFSRLLVGLGILLGCLFVIFYATLHLIRVACMSVVGARRCLLEHEQHHIAYSCGENNFTCSTNHSLPSVLQVGAEHQEPSLIYGGVWMA